MHFKKIPPAANFRYEREGVPLLSAPESGLSSVLRDLGEDVFALTVEREGWERKSQAPLRPNGFRSTSGRASVECGETGLRLLWEGREILSSFPGRAFGVLGKKWNLCFGYRPEMRFHGLGEKNTGFEKSGQITKFYNTDAFFDFGFAQAEQGVTDPMYASIPYVLVETPGACAGILVNNPYPVFMNLGADENIANLMDAAEAEPRAVSVGAYDGTPEIYFLIGADAREVTRKLQRLTGLTPLPPLWALGYHQCRFGYRDLGDLEELDRRFDELGIPCDGLWLDIDYMDGFRVFTVAADGFRNHRERMADLQEKGRKIVPILDPGVKQSEGFPVFQRGRSTDVFCKTCEGGIYSGFVWPGTTAFPDYSLPRAREWWAEEVRRFTEAYGFDGYWIDMNDPSTGSADLDDMLFNEGRDSHESYHNQYALGMQEATRDGILRARPGKRPFVISRSGFIGTQNYSALWTGDNWSNYFHLREGVALSLNLSLSGIPFNGPDVPGFGGEATPELALDWHKATFLFPFFRNHSANLSPPQEPWRFPEPFRSAMIRFLRLRYRFLPYLYNLFHEHRETGDPVLRPLFYEFPGEHIGLHSIGDQFLVGPSVLQAPVLDEGRTARNIYFPKAEWFNPRDGDWLAGGSHDRIETGFLSTGLYFREDSLIPLLPVDRAGPGADLAEIELHAFLKPGSESVASLDYHWDDGETLDALVDRVRFEAQARDGNLHVHVAEPVPPRRELRFRIVAYGCFAGIFLHRAGTSRSLGVHADEEDLNGTRLAVCRSESCTLAAAGHPARNQTEPSRI